MYVEARCLSDVGGCSVRSGSQDNTTTRLLCLIDCVYCIDPVGFNVYMTG